jgi:hypothetical protein
MNGIIYIAFGNNFLAEAKRSANSVKSCSGLPVCLISDAGPQPGFDNYVHFDPVHRQYPLLNKPYALSTIDLPYDNFIFLDTDTYVLSDLSSLFDLLDRFDIGACQCRDGAPLFGFPYLNTGVILAAARLKFFFKRWYDLAVLRIRDYKHNDQASFYDAIIESNLSVCVLAPEFNVRISTLVYVSGPAHILHGRHYRMKYAIKTINDSLRPRVWNGRKATLSEIYEKY